MFFRKKDDFSSYMSSLLEIWIHILLKNDCFLEVNYLFFLLMYMI